MKSQTVYFDNSIWSLLTRLFINSPGTYREYQIKIENRQDIFICYSAVNVRETIRRDIEEHLHAEVCIINELSQGRFLEKDGSIVESSFEEVVPRVEAQNEMISRLETVFDTSENDQVNDFGLDKIEQNNYPPETAIDMVFKNAFEAINGLPKKDSSIALDRIKEDLLAKINEMLIESFSSSESADVVNSIMVFFRAALDAVFTEGLDATSKVLNSKNSGDFLENLISVNDDDSWKNMVLAGLLQVFQFHPDSKKVLEKKGKQIDNDDYEHVGYATYCDLFVTKDTRLAKRYQAILEKRKLKNNVISFQEFISMLDQSIAESE